jgi:hypothetical protein
MATYEVRRAPVCSRGSPADVTVWRVRRLSAAGFARPLAQRLAATPGIDLHAVLELVDRGCPPALAARILAPLNWPDP